MGKIIIVIDTNVILSSMISTEGVTRRLFLLPKIDDSIKLFYSDKVLEEIRRNFKILIRKTGLSLITLKRALDKLLADSNLIKLKKVNDKKKLRKFVKHENDAHVVALAFQIKADYIITYNKKDFNAKSLSPKSIKIRTPTELFKELGYYWVDKTTEKKKKGLRMKKYKWMLSKRPCW